MKFERTASVCLIILTVIAVAVGLFYTSSVMIPFILAVLTAFLLAPVVRFLQLRLKLRRWVALCITFTVVFLIFAGLCWIIIGTVQVALSSVNSYQENIRIFAGEMLERLAGFGVDTSAIPQEQLMKMLAEIPVLSYFGSAAGGALTILSNAVLVFIIVGFLLTGQTSSGLSKSKLYREVVAKINLYLATKVFTSALTGALTVILLQLLGLNMAIMFGMFAFFLNFIPTIGSIVAALLPLPVAMLQQESYWFWAAVVLIPGTVQFVVGNVLEPKMVGENLDLHPVTTVLVLMFWGLIWGVPGMFLAVPLTVVIRIFLDSSEGGKKISEIMAGRFSPQA